MKQIRLTTPVVPDAAPFSIGPTDSCLLMGSCFTENISTRLEAAGFDILTNPFGISYNPLSMADAVERILDGRGVGETQLVERDGLWHSWLHHGSFSRHTKEACLSACNESLSAGHAFLDACQVVMFTFGSAWHYRLQRDGSVVNNCHKVPADAFSCRLATLDEVVESWLPLLERLHMMGKRVLFTVSPVRHGAYGAHGNQLGKAVLLLAVERLRAALGSSPSWFYYFPAYEIMMDELRDYRFYADDLLHPSSMAEEIIWQRFQQVLMTPQACDLVACNEKHARQQAHRPLH